MQHTGSGSRSPFHGWVLFLCGICMGTADLVPGISGGTVAFILGFYQQLLESLKSINWQALQLLFKGNVRDFFRQIEWKFLLTLLSGIAFAFICLANVFHVILSHELYRIYLYSLFFGLIVASFVYCMRQVSTWNLPAVLALCVGAIIAYCLTETTLSSTKEGNFSVRMEIETNGLALRNYDHKEHLLHNLSPQLLGVLREQGALKASDPVYNDQGEDIGLVGMLAAPPAPFFFNAWLIICGSLAVCALLLPGISGSYILTLLGVYPIVIEALVDFINGLSTFSFHPQAVATLGSLGIGILLGAIVFARGVSWLLRVYPQMTLAILSGFMIGAIRSVWPFWSYDYAILPLKLQKGAQLIILDPILPSLHTGLFWQAIACAAAGFILVFGMEKIVQHKSTV